MGTQVTDEKKQLLLNIRGEDPLQAVSPMYSNFVAVSRIGAEVQFEFLFVDINQLAILIDQARKSESFERQDITAKTVAKIVMPGLSFMQVKEHLNEIFKALAEALQIQEARHELHRTGSRSPSGSSVS